MGADRKRAAGARRHAPGLQPSRLDIADCECGGTQLRRRHVQFLSLRGHIIRPHRERNTAASRGHPHLGDGSSVTYLRRDLPPPRVFRARHAAGLEPGGEDPAVGNGVPLSIGRALTIAVSQRSSPDRHDCIAFAADRSPRPPSKPGPPAGKEWSAAKVHRRKNGVVSHTGKSRIYAAAHDCHGGHARRTCHARSHDRVTRKRRSVVTPARFPGPDTRPGPVTHVSHGRVTRKRRSVVTPARFPGPTRGQDLSRT